MFYFLIYQSSITEYYNTEKKYLTSFFWGTISYIITHACLSSSLSPVMLQLKKSFWLFFLIDVGVLFYMHAYMNTKNAETDDSIVDELLKKMNLDKNTESKPFKKDDNENNTDLTETVKTHHYTKRIKHNNEESDIHLNQKYKNDTVDENTENLIISSDNENNISYPITTNNNSSKSGKLSTPINQLDSDDDNGMYIDDNDSGSDIDIEQFDEYLK